MRGSASSFSVIFSLRRSSPLSRCSKPASQPQWSFSCTKACASAESPGSALRIWAIASAVSACRSESAERSAAGRSGVRPASLVVDPHVQEPGHIIPVAALTRPCRVAGPIQAPFRRLRRFRGNERAHRLVVPAAFVRVGQLTRLGRLPVRVGALHPPGFVWLVR